MLLLHAKHTSRNSAAPCVLGGRAGVDGAFQEVVVPARCAAFLRANAYELWEAPLCFCWSLLQPGLWDGQACDWLRAGDA